MDQAKKKLFIAGISMLVALAMIAGTAFAWFTVSTKPEAGGVTFKLSTGRTLLLSDSEDGKYAYSINLSDKFKNLADLHPISTADGINWFTPTYAGDGFPDPDTQKFVLVKVGDGYDNVSIIDPSTGKPYTGQDLNEIQDTGYFVWTDIFLKTEEEGGCEVHLSIPKTIDKKELDGFYGSYVLPRYELNKEGVAESVSYGSEAAVRIGFLVMDGDDKNRFVIYEPNAELRSSEEGMPTPEDGHYVVGYEMNLDTHKNGNYIPTSPIGLVGEAEEITYDLYTLFEGGDSSNLYVEQLYLPVPAESYDSGHEYYVKSGSKYEYYTGDGTGSPQLYELNYKPQEYYDPDNAVHYFTEEYVPYNPENGDAFLYELDVEKAEYNHVTDVVEGNTYFVKTYLPYSGKQAGKAPTGLVAIGFVPAEYDPDSSTKYYFMSEETASIQGWGETTVPADRLVVQASGKYDEEEVQKALDAVKDKEGEEPVFNSTMVQKFGHFISPDLTKIDEIPLTESNESYYGKSVIVHLKKDEPVRVRLFVWIEGQDADCWNLITSGAFNVNLELAGSTY